MEPTEIPKSLAFNESFEMPTLIQSPMAYNDKSTLDITRISAANTSALFSPSPKYRVIESCESPIRSPFPVRSSIDKAQSRRLHSTLEQKLLKIEESSKTKIADRSFDYQENMKIAIDIEDEYEFSTHSRKSLEIPRLIWCAACKAEKTTQVRYVNDSKTFWSSVGIFLSGGVFGCFMLPYMLNSCKGVEVLCGSCGRIVG